MATSKRNKKYNPMAFRQRIANLERQKDVALAHQKIVPQYFEMAWNSEEVERRKAEWKAQNNGCITAGQMIEVFDNQSFAIVNQCDLIKKPISWEVGIQISFYNPKTGEVVTRQNYIDLPSMEYGCIFNPKEKIKIDLGNGLKVRWQGIAKIVDVSGLTNDFVVASTDLWVRAYAEFKNIASLTRYCIYNNQKKHGKGSLRQYVDFKTV